MIVREVKAGQNGVLGKALQDDRVIVCVDVVGPAGPNIGSYDYHSLFQSPVRAIYVSPGWSATRADPG